MSNGLTLAPDASQALEEAQNLCQQANIAIVAPEHLLAGALLVLSGSGVASLPGEAQLRSAAFAAQGTSAEPLSTNVMFGSAAREAINFVAREVRRAGGTEITAAALAAGTITSNEVGPMFFSVLGLSRDALLQAMS